MSVPSACVTQGLLWILPSHPQVGLYSLVQT